MLRRRLLASLVGTASAAWALPFGNADAAPRDRAYRSAVSRIASAIARDAADAKIAHTGLPRLYHHGGRVRNAVVLFHGFTNCPQQFDEFAMRLYRGGCNVYVPRIPFHGYRDRLTPALEALTEADLSATASAAVGAVRPLGERVTVLGLSLGGAMALELAQNEPIDHAIAVAPFLLPIGVPRFVGVPAMDAVARLPDDYIWWDPRVREKCLPLYAYPGFPTHALATLVLFADTVARSARRARPLGRSCTLVTNSHESAVNNDTSLALMRRWTLSGAPYRSISLDDLGPPRHDIIDPTTFPEARRLVYPTLERLVFADAS